MTLYDLQREFDDYLTLLILRNQDMKFTSTISGLTPKGYSVPVNTLADTSNVFLLRAITDNKYDPNAIQVRLVLSEQPADENGIPASVQIGWIPAKSPKKVEVWNDLMEGAQIQGKFVELIEGPRYSLLAIEFDYTSMDEVDAGGYEVEEVACGALTSNHFGEPAPTAATGDDMLANTDPLDSKPV